MARPRRVKNFKDLSAVMQHVADGIKLQDALMAEKIPLKTGEAAIRRLRKQHNIKTNYQLLAHFLRNSWID